MIVNKIKKLYSKVKTIFLDIFKESQHISWPSIKEIKNKSIAVITFIVVLAIFLLITDQLFAIIRNVFLNR